MGMFDHVTCQVEGWECKKWQSKDTPEQMMSEYTITRDGILLDEQLQKEWFTGAINFYTLDEDAEDCRDTVIEVSALFLQGELVAMVKGGAGVLDHEYCIWKPCIGGGT